MRLLNCDVPTFTWRRWTEHFVPPLQPFFLSDELAAQLPGRPKWTRQEFRALDYPLSLTDTFALYHVSPAAPWVVLLDENTFYGLPPFPRAAMLREQLDHGRARMERVSEWTGRLPKEAFARADGGLFVWWPSLWTSLSNASQVQVLGRLITEDRLPHRGDELSAEHWRQVDAALPGVRRYAGTFAPDSGPNCLSTVLAAWGEFGVAELWLHGGPFERWLGENAIRTQRADELGSVLVWRGERRDVQHAAVSLGSGWVFQKDAQCWFAPRQIVRLEDVRERFGAWNELFALRKRP